MITRHDGGGDPRSVPVNRNGLPEHRPYRYRRQDEPRETPSEAAREAEIAAKVEEIRAIARRRIAATDALRKETWR